MCNSERYRTEKYRRSHMHSRREVHRSDADSKTSRGEAAEKKKRGGGRDLKKGEERQQPQPRERQPKKPTTNHGATRTHTCTHAHTW